MSSGMNTEQAKKYAKTMTYSQAVSNIKYSKFIKYRKATMIKLRELAEIADRLDRKTEQTEWYEDEFEVCDSRKGCDNCEYHICKLEQTEYTKWETKPTADIPTEITTCVGVAMALVEDDEVELNEDERSRVQTVHGSEVEQMEQSQQRVKFFVSTKAELLEEKVNNWLDEHNNIAVISLQPFMSYSTIKEKGVYMIGCMLHYIYIEEIVYEIEEEENGLPS